jgi:hypothetical protein
MYDQTPMIDLTTAEINIINLLAEAFNQHCDLPVVHDNYPREFCEAIHRAQHLIMCRPAQEVFNKADSP